MAFFLPALIFGALSSRKSGQEGQAVGEFKARLTEVQAGQARERAREEEKLQKERVDFEVQREKENLAFELSVAAESTDVAIDRTTKIFKEVRGTQRAAAAAAGLSFTGSTRAVMERSNRNFQDDVNEIRRAFTVFSRSRIIESAQFEEGQEFTLGQFLERNKRESRFEQANRRNEATLFRLGGDIALSRGNRAAVGGLLSGAADIASLFTPSI